MVQGGQMGEPRFEPPTAQRRRDSASKGAIQILPGIHLSGAGPRSVLGILTLKTQRIVRAEVKVIVNVDRVVLYLALFVLAILGR